MWKEGILALDDPCDAENTEQNACSERFLGALSGRGAEGNSIQQKCLIWNPLFKMILESYLVVFGNSN